MSSGAHDFSQPWSDVKSVLRWAGEWGVVTDSAADALRYAPLGTTAESWAGNWCIRLDALDAVRRDAVVRDAARKLSVAAARNGVDEG